MPFLNRGMGLMGGGAIKRWLAGGIDPADVVVAYEPMGAASLAASYVNLAHPGTNDAAPGVAPTLDASGWVFDGVTQYLTTGIVPTANTTVIVRFSDGATSGLHQLFGINGATPDDYLAFWQCAETVSYYLYGNLLETAMITGGVIAMAGKAAYKNGVADGVGASDSIVPTIPVYIGRANGALYYFSGKIQRIYIYNRLLSAGEVATSTAAINS